MLNLYSANITCKIEDLCEHLLYSKAVGRGIARKDFDKYIVIKL